MKKLLLLLAITFITHFAFSQDITSTCQKINELNNRVLNSTIKRADAAKQFKTLLAKIKGNAAPGNPTWVFPLAGYKSSAIGGTNGNGYSDKGYNYLDGNKHSAHPAHDIFIKDVNQDGMDDSTLKPVDVLAVADGIVVACTNNWEPTSTLRGGKFIWIYHPASGIFSYYAHNRAIFVKPGDELKAGDKIAEVGRTGLNAYKKRSPTHLHFSAFKIVRGLPVPFNPYQQLFRSTKR
ncbi:MULTISPECIES: M23 family metallopeptidase [unclassified Mucilaginibacter]|uniref:M23 family metallopeptidase n=1 Tax=unclassified Mucilaginibacter TaxID=2617802 RepID=UPI002AC8ADD9|nr:MULTISPECIES: M23 family metallopeptidase [unclassified Mucilaginibacter]MEB0263400.1 M23 family metallopeptidase [Mucilaginibacter sp. 10I4]MEB0278571.1 M23 family metallopeptidase [Mucilaginibacter sp. 10B2]MEB0299282.1 M23 family metallopeptidase [Mucilaginibacter sp. 5C4]WPX23473.1 M23 family metallopeptidase [Mucilaginibacter sp. 5C4]